MLSIINARLLYTRYSFEWTERSERNCEIVNDQISTFKKIFSSDKRNYQTKSVIHDKDMHIYFYRPQLKKKKDNSLNKFWTFHPLPLLFFIDTKIRDFPENF